MNQLAATTTTTNLAHTHYTLSAATSNLDRHHTPSTPWYFWIVVAMCILLLGLTIATLYFGHLKARRTKKVPDGEDNLLADPH